MKKLILGTVNSTCVRSGVPCSFLDIVLSSSSPGRAYLSWTHWRCRTTRTSADSSESESHFCNCHLLWCWCFQWEKFTFNTSDNMQSRLVLLLMPRAVFSYLQVEWEVRRGTPRLFTSDSMRSSNCRVPQQDNSSDCGLYLLQYAESFLQVCKHPILCMIPLFESGLPGRGSPLHPRTINSTVEGEHPLTATK